MFKKLLAMVALLAAFGQVFAAVDVNTASEAALLGIKGIGSAKAKAILDERAANGPYKDGADLSKRVKGMGGKTVERLQAEGLSVGPAGAAGVAQAAAQPKAAAAPAGAQKTGAAVVVKK